MKRELLIKKIETLKDEMPNYVIEYYYSKMSVPYSLTTMFEYLKEFKRFFSWLIDAGVAENATDIDKISLDTLEHLKKTDMESYISYLRELPRKNTQATDNGLSQRTINRTITSLSSLFKFLTEEVENADGEPYFYRNVMKKINTRKKIETLSARAANIKPKLFLGDESKEYLEFIENTYQTKLDSKQKLAIFLKNKERDLAINALMLSSGIRLSELVNLNVDDVNLNTTRIDILRKGGKKDSVLVAKFGLNFLEAYMNIRKERYQPEKNQKALFLSQYRGQANRIDTSSVEKLVGKYSKAFKIKVSPHKLRHTLATRLYEETNSQVLVAHQLGHSSTQVTDLYTHIVDDRQKNALDFL